MRIIRGLAEAKATLFNRPPLDQIAVPPAVARRIKETFGQDLSAAQVVDKIVNDVRVHGDKAVRDYTKRIDGVDLASLEVTKKELRAASVDRKLLSALKLSADRIRRFHEKRVPQPTVDMSEGGLGWLVRPLERVGLYVPGGAAAYPSTVLMTAIPARVAGVSEVIVVTPPARDGSVPPALLVAARLAGVDRIFRVGGAQAVAALAWGTETIPKVDKICGPGNIFVTLAKKLVFGAVAIDGLYGPTETVVVADAAADAALCAADLLAQAEHDPLASALLVTTSAAFAEKVSLEVERQLVSLERAQIARESIENRGGIAVVGSMKEAMDLVNDYGPEHLCMMVKDAWDYVGKVRHAGGVFLGESSPEAVGDYTAGPSHVMPTGGSARFGSPLGIEAFVKATSLVALNKATFDKVGPAAAVIARAEGLTAHARAVEKRLHRATRRRKPD